MPGSIPGETVCDVWWTKRRLGRLPHPPPGPQFSPDAIILPVLRTNFCSITVGAIRLQRHLDLRSTGIDCSWNVMAHAQKPDFVFRAKRTSPFKSSEASVQSTTGSRSVRISGSNAWYTMFRGSVKGTGYPLHSPVSPSLPPPVRHRVPSHFNWTLLHSA